VIRLLALAAAALLAGCQTCPPTRPLIETRTVEVPVLTPVPVSPSLTDPPAEPQLPPERLNGEALVDRIEALEAYACSLRAKLADIAIKHGAGGEPVICTD
jgi:hypothetical protein